MTDEINELIKTAIQMEKDGCEFYKKAAAQTSSKMGATLFQSIADDEFVHLRTFEKMFAEEISREEYEAVERTATKYADLPVFPHDLRQIEGANPDSDELAALQIAMDAEKEAIDFYEKIKGGLSTDEGKKIVDMIIGQEKSHYLLLSEELSHLNTTGYWYDLGPLGV